MSKIVDQVMSEIFTRDGVLDPVTIHDEASDPAHPLHDRYEWDDTVAGRKFRLGQISNDIRTCTVRFISSNDEEAEVKKYTSVRKLHHPTLSSGYLLTEDVVKDPLSAKMLIRQLKRELASIQRRYGDLEEYTTLVQQAAKGEVA